MRPKPEMVIGGGVPSWTKSIPGPIYSYDTNCFKEKQPVFSIRGRGDDDFGNKNAKDAPQISTEQLMKGIDASRKKPPSWSLKSRPAMVPGDAVPSWVASIPGPKYHYPVDCHKKKQPVYSIGKKLPSESDLMKVRSPGPMRYDGPAMESKKQEMVDSTRPPSWETSLKDLGSNIPVPSMWPREAACGRQNCFWWLYHCCVVRGLEPEMPAADFSLMKRGVEKTDAD
ncbi:unnamed protein product [Symbiodinium natans]|uniref:Uncharacterized protein n=1 Tax=Symbiodinium natans TaxID=878477 RepID=A0A812L2X0_9DINO|nr:unnamed protein product [Symbiodinium natans]